MMTLYEIIGASRYASTEEIEAAFSRKLAEFSLLHALGSEKAATMINELKNAKKVLTDPVKRAEYDRTLSAEKGTVHVDLRKPDRTENRPISLRKPEREAAPVQEIMPQPRSVELTKPVAEDIPVRVAAPAPVITEAEKQSTLTEDRSTDHPLLSYLIRNAIAFAIFTVILLVATASYQG